MMPGSRGAGRDRVDTDTVAAVFGGGGSAHGDDGSFRRPVHALPGGAEGATDAADVDDRATSGPLRGHRLQFGAHRQPYALEVGLEDGVEGLVGDLGEAAAALAAAGVVQSAVEAPPLLDRGRDGSLYLFAVGGVGLNGEDVASVGGDVLGDTLEFGFAAGGDDDVRAFAGEQKRGGPADPDEAPVMSMVLPASRSVMVVAPL